MPKRAKSTRPAAPSNVKADDAKAVWISAYLVDQLIKILEGRPQFVGLVKQLKSAKAEFKDSAQKLKEVTARVRANSHWEEPKTARIEVAGCPKPRAVKKAIQRRVANKPQPEAQGTLFD